MCDQCGFGSFSPWLLGCRGHQGSPGTYTWELMDQKEHGSHGYFLLCAALSPVLSTGLWLPSVAWLFGPGCWGLHFHFFVPGVQDGALPRGGLRKGTLAGQNCLVRHPREQVAANLEFPGPLGSGQRRLEVGPGLAAAFM